MVDQQWGAGLVRSWADWVSLPQQAGDLLGEVLLGAAPGQVVVTDSTTVNLYKLACAALRAQPGRRVIVTDDDNFPTDRYVLDGVAAQFGAELRMVHTDLDEGISQAALAAAVGPDTALVSLSHVAYRSGALADMAALTALVHEAGAPGRSGTCATRPARSRSSWTPAPPTWPWAARYKYLNAGPGAPAFLYVRQDLQDRLRPADPGLVRPAGAVRDGPGLRSAAHRGPVHHRDPEHPRHGSGRRRAPGCSARPASRPCGTRASC